MIYCAIDGHGDGADRWFYRPDDEAPLTTKRSRKCCSCGARISVGETARKVRRYRTPTEFEETRGIACDEVEIAAWYLCESCGDLAESLLELGFGYQLGVGKSLKEQLADYRRAEADAMSLLSRMSS